MDLQRKDIDGYGSIYVRLDIFPFGEDRIQVGIQVDDLLVASAQGSTLGECLLKASLDMLGKDWLDGFESLLGQSRLLLAAEMEKTNAPGS